jgi:F0F1-type ATP synthase, alpha subunit
LNEIKAQIAGAKVTAAKQNVGVIREVGDGVAKIEGLSDAMLNEMIDLGNGVTGLALNLDETEVGVVILGDYTQLKEGGEARTTGKLLQVPVGKGLLGRVVNLLGEPIDGKGPIKSDKTYPVEKTAPGIIRRRSVNQPVQTGIMPIDAMIPIGRGQRELIIGDRGTGKTTICIDTIISQARLNKAAELAGDKDYRPALLHLRRDRPEAIDHRAGYLGPRTSRRDAVHDRCGVPGLGLRRQPVSRAICWCRDGRVVHG